MRSIFNDNNETNLTSFGWMCDTMQKNYGNTKGKNGKKVGKTQHKPIFGCIS